MENKPEINYEPKEYVVLEIKKHQESVQEVNTAINLEKSIVKISRYLELFIIIVSIVTILNMYKNESRFELLSGSATLILNLILIKLFKILEENSTLKLELYRDLKKHYLNTISSLKDYSKTITNESLSEVDIKLNELVIGRNNEYQYKR